MEWDHFDDAHTPIATPRDAGRVLLTLSRILGGTNAWGGGMRAAMRANELTKSLDWRVHLLQGLCMEAQGNVPAAMDSYAHASALRPEEAEWYILQARCFAHVGREKEKRALLRQCAERWPDHPYLGRVAEEDAGRARERLHRAMRVASAVALGAKSGGRVEDGLSEESSVASSDPRRALAMAAARAALPARSRVVASLLRSMLARQRGDLEDSLKDVESADKHFRRNRSDVVEPLSASWPLATSLPPLPPHCCAVPGAHSDVIHQRDRSLLAMSRAYLERSRPRDAIAYAFHALAGEAAIRAECARRMSRLTAPPPTSSPPHPSKPPTVTTLLPLEASLTAPSTTLPSTHPHSTLLPSTSSLPSPSPPVQALCALLLPAEGAAPHPFFLGDAISREMISAGAATSSLATLHNPPNSRVTGSQVPPLGAEFILQCASALLACHAPIDTLHLLYNAATSNAFPERPQRSHPTAPAIWATALINSAVFLWSRPSSDPHFTIKLLRCALDWTQNEYDGMDEMEDGRGEEEVDSGFRTGGHMDDDDESLSMWGHVRLRLAQVLIAMGQAKEAVMWASKVSKRFPKSKRAATVLALAKDEFASPTPLSQLASTLPTSTTSTTPTTPTTGFARVRRLSDALERQRQKRSGSPALSRKIAIQSIEAQQVGIAFPKPHIDGGDTVRRGSTTSLPLASPMRAKKPPRRLPTPTKLLPRPASPHYSEFSLPRAWGEEDGVKREESGVEAPSPPPATPPTFHHPSTTTTTPSTSTTSTTSLLLSPSSLLLPATSEMPPPPPFRSPALPKRILNAGVLQSPTSSLLKHSSSATTKRKKKKRSKLRFSPLPTLASKKSGKGKRVVVATQSSHLPAGVLPKDLSSLPRHSKRSKQPSPPSFAFSTDEKIALSPRSTFSLADESLPRALTPVDEWEEGGGDDGSLLRFVEGE